MMPRRPLLLCLGLALLASGGAHAGTLTSATWYQAIGVDTLSAPHWAFPMTRTTLQLGATGSSTATSVAVSLSYPFFSTNFIVPPSANGVVGRAIKISQGGPQSLTATPGMGHGTPAIPGTVHVMTAGHNAMGVNQSMFKVGINTLVKLPLSNGRAGTEVLGWLAESPTSGPSYWTIVGAVHRGTISFFAWTPGTLVFSGLTSRGVALPSVVAMGSFDLDANGRGTVTLVAPSKISIDGSFEQRRTASFTKLVLSFVPEPGACLLLAGGVAALGWIGRRRRT